MPSQNSGARFRQIADDLRAAIKSGEYPPGSRLPGEAELRDRYEVSLTTVNTAVGMLRAEGLVSGTKGRPTIVNEVRLIHRHVPGRYRRDARERSGGHGAFDSEIAALGMEPRSDVTVGRVAASPEVADLLQIAPGTQVVTRSRQMFADGSPVQLATSYIPPLPGEGPLTETDSGLGGIVSRYAEMGFAQVRMTEAWRIGYATAEQAEFLHVEEKAPVWLVDHIGWTAAGLPVELCQHVMPANWVNHVAFDV